MTASNQTGSNSADDRDRLGQLIDRFSQLALRNPGPTNDAFTLTGRKDAPQIAIGLIIHGNEHGTLPAALEWAELMESRARQNPLPAQLTFFLGNTPAAKAGRRFLEHDLNRQFHDKAPESLEGKRALELRSILATCDLFIDLHQTIEKTDRPFFIFAFHRPSVQLASALAPGVTTTLVTRRPGSPFANGQMCADEFVRTRGKPAITIEVGQRGFRDEADRTTTQVLANLQGCIDNGHIKRLCAMTQYAKEYKDSTQEQMTGLNCYEISHRIPFAQPGYTLSAGFCNFQEIQKGQELGTTGDGLVFTSPASGFALFPKYPERDSIGNALAPVPQDILCIAEERGPAANLVAQWDK
jgi:succinylglutamate desuccinylase